jgi:hypothetical protein
MGKDGTVRQSGKLGSLSADDPARGGEGRPRAPYHAPTLNALLIENSAAAAGGKLTTAREREQGTPVVLPSSHPERSGSRISRTCPHVVLDPKHCGHP